jgi:hypothetical protein
MRVEPLGNAMSDQTNQVGRAAMFEWPITIISGILLCAVTVSGAEALRSHGIVVLVVTLIGVTGIMQSFASNKHLGKSSTAITLGVLFICILTSSVLWISDFLPSLFIASAFCLTQVCAVSTRNTPGRGVNGTALILGFSSGLIAGLSALASLDFDAVVLLMCLTSLILAVWDLSFGRPHKTKHLKPRLNCLTMANTPDILIAPFLLSPSQAIHYFSVRLLITMLPALLNSFETWVAPAIYHAHRQSKPAEFVQVMARVNLSYFLTAAAIAVMLLTVQPMANLPTMNADMTSNTTIYLMLGAFLPAALGQSSIVTQLLLSQSVKWITHLAGAGAAFLTLIIQTSIQAQDLALAYFLYRFSGAAIQSIWTIKENGIWPGPTALFVKQIRLLG